MSKIKGSFAILFPTQIFLTTDAVLCYVEHISIYRRPNQCRWDGHLPCIKHGASRPLCFEDASDDSEVAQDMQIQIGKTFSKYKFLLHGFTTCFARSSQIHTFIGGYVTLFLDCKDSNFGSAKMGSGSVEVLLVTGRIQVQIPSLPEKNCITKPLSSVTGLHSSSLELFCQDKLHKNLGNCKNVHYLYR